MSYRQSPFANLTQVVKILLIINLVFFIAFKVFDPSEELGPVTKLFGLFYFNGPFFKPWQFITYMFMHGGWEHIIFNMFALFSFGPILEYAIGPKRFLNLYLICGLGAAVLQMFVQAIEVHNLTGSFTIAQPYLNSSYEQFGYLAEQLKGIYLTPLVGASGAVFGVLVAFGMLYPNMELMLLFIPVPIKAKYLISIYIIYELFAGFRQAGGDNVAHFAHIGGALIGFILIKVWRYR